MSDIKIVVGADVSQAVTGLRVVQGELGKTANVSRATTSAFSSFGSSISSLGSSLLGGGIALGISLLVSGLIVLGKEMFAVSKEQKQLNDVLDAAKSSYVKAYTEVDKLKVAFEQAKSGIISKGEALKLFNTTIGKTIGQTKDFESAERSLIANADNYIKFTLLKAAANIALGKAAEAAFQAELEREKGPTKAGLFDIRRLAARGPTGGRTDEQAQQDRINKALKEENSFRAISLRLQEQAKAFGFDYNAISESNVKSSEKQVKSLRTISDVLAEMRAQISFLNTKELLLNTDESKAKIAALQAAFDELIKKFKLGIDNPIIVDLAFQINYAKVKADSAALLARTKKITSDEFAKDTDKKKIIVKVIPEVVSDYTLAERQAAQQAQAFAEKLNGLIQSITLEAFSGLGEAIGNALAGNNVLPDLFDGLIKSLGGQVKELGKFLIKTGVEMLAAKKAIAALKLNPALTIVAGIALTALGALLQSAVSKKYPGFAAGVRNFDGGLATVGERGPETVFLPRGSSVQPNNQVTAYGGGSSNGYIAETQISLDSLWIGLKRTQSKFDRNN